ncbi:SURF1 family protein [Solilutibacter tolerans]|uniref:SURF1-like protein n=1 Tax=Solilutibacter tolerans TaxID=1604334 RepID=A0A1N6QU88_9GAMM|nr:SURF1 family protein [Lysobacter tolerans]SIQ20184.1 Cytochrome oxidase assembly protein ShyY1 [Lysobacter tolerans]
MNRHAATPVIGWTIAIVLMAIGCALGTWQLRRMHQKETMLASVATVLRERTPQPLAIASDDTRKQTYDWAAGEGRFLQQPAWLVDNQQRDGRPGVRVFRLFKPLGNGMPLLVEMGWMPVGAARQMPVVGSAPAATIAIKGLLLPPPSSGLLAGAESQTPDGQHLVIALDPATIATRSGVARIAPRVLRLDPDMPLGHARDLDVLPNTLPPERHLGYAVQWFALAAAVLIIAILLTLRQRRRP